jgi:hypothetical protein
MLLGPAGPQKVRGAYLLTRRRVSVVPRTHPVIWSPLTISEGVDP